MYANYAITHKDLIIRSVGTNDVDMRYRYRPIHVSVTNSCEKPARGYNSWPYYFWRYDPKRKWLRWLHQLLIRWTVVVLTGVLLSIAKDGDLTDLHLFGTYFLPLCSNSVNMWKIELEFFAAILGKRIR